MNENSISVLSNLPVICSNGGFFVSRGEGTHPNRVITSYELIFVRRGVLAIQEEQQEFSVAAGQSLLLWPGKRHWGTAPFSADLSFFWIHFTLQQELSIEHASELIAPKYATLSRPDHLTELFRRFLDDQESGALSPTSASLFLLLILNEIACFNQPSDRQDSTSVTLASRAETYIKTHYHKKLSSSIIADDLQCNPNYLNRIYSQEYGKTITAAIQHRRLVKARQLLIEDTSNIDEIARTCGFSEAGYFRRLFKREEGMAPLQFRLLYSRLHINSD